MSSKEELIEFFEGQIEIEKEIVGSIREAISALKNIAIKGVLTGISRDSSKHADMYSAAIEFLTKVPTALSEKELDEHTQIVKRHIELEERVIGGLKGIVNKIKDSKIESLIQAIYSDELYHHALLKRVLDTIVQKETILDEEWFDVIWKDVPFHGGPGG